MRMRKMEVKSIYNLTNFQRANCLKSMFFTNFQRANCLKSMFFLFAVARLTVVVFVLGSSLIPRGVEDKSWKPEKMFTCIACTKPVAEEEEGGRGAARGSETPNTKEAIKSLTTQIKGMALKCSVAYRQCKPGTSSIGNKKEYRPYPDFDSSSEGVPYPYFGGGSSSSTPAWDFTSGSHHHHGMGLEPRFSGLFSGDQTTGGVDSCVVLEHEDVPKEWMAQVEPGVHITFVSLPNGGNDLRRIRFSRDMFNKWEAQRWWGENYDRIMELYNVQRFNRQDLHTPPRSEDETRYSTCTRIDSAKDSPIAPAFTPGNYHGHPGSKGHLPSEHSYGGYSMAAGPKGDASRTTTSSRDDNASDVEAEWVEEDEPGVYITIRQLVDGTRELRRVRFSRERFGEVHAKLWWEQNRERIQVQYL